MTQDTQAYTATDLSIHLKTIGVKEGDTLIVHSSMKAIGQVEPGPQAVIDGLVEAVGPTGHIMMPAFCAPKPGVDLRTEPTRLGLIPNIFLQYPGVLRSNHATHSVACIGPDSKRLLADHEKTTGLGKNSPMHKAAELGAKVLHLGTQITSCSVIHVAEAIEKVPYLDVAYPGYERDFDYIDANGNSHHYHCSEAPGDSAAFGVVMESPELTPHILTGCIGNAPSFLVPASVLLNQTQKLLKQNPTALLCNNPKCAVCPTSYALCTETS